VGESQVEESEDWDAMDAENAKEVGDAGTVPISSTPNHETMNGNTSGYDRELFDRVLLGASAPGKRVKTILCWRGFLVETPVEQCGGGARKVRHLLGKGNWFLWFRSSP
jgi:hypothetical protein